MTWVEEPARRWDYRGLRNVSQSVRAAVATGENLNQISDYLPLISNEAVDVVQLGVGTTGITGALQVAHLAYAYDLPVSIMNCPGNFMGHLGASLPNHMMMEFVDAGRSQILQVDSYVEDGWLILGNSSGLGITFDPDKLQQHAVTAPSPGSGPSPWGRRWGAGLYRLSPEENQPARD